MAQKRSPRFMVSFPEEKLAEYKAYASKIGIPLAVLIRISLEDFIQRKTVTKVTYADGREVSSEQI